MTERPDHEPLEYDYITDGIYIGANVCCQVHFDERLVSEGIEADISLEAERVDAPFGVQFYLWLPVVDHTAPTPEQFVVGVAALETLVRLHKKVYVHCKSGHGRAPTLVAAYFIKQGKTLEEAEQLLAAKRSGLHIREVQREALQAWQQSLQAYIGGTMNQWIKRLPRWLAPIIGAGGIGVCPLCWAGSAALLTYVGLGALIPVWRWIAFTLIGLGLVGFMLDYRAHKNIYPTLLLLAGGILLYIGRYVFGGEGFGGWPIWGLGAIIIIFAVVYNKRLFRKPDANI